MTLATLLARLLKPFNVMVVDCGWCKKLLGFKSGNIGISTGICRKCYNKFTGKDL